MSHNSKNSLPYKNKGITLGLIAARKGSVGLKKKNLIKIQNQTITKTALKLAIKCSNIDNVINNLEVVSLILDNDREKARLKIKKIPHSLKKIKFLIALLLPNNFVKRFIRF